MPKIMQDLIKQYVEEVKKIYGSHVRQIILYGSYARGDFRPDSDVDIMTARNVGMPCISVLWGFRDREFLIGHGAQALIGRPEEIWEYL